MSNVDERVVRMEFDNKAFEKNAEDTISLLDKLKETLKFDNVKDSFSKITKAANKVDVSNIDRNIQTVKMSFSAMEVAGITAIANLTNSLMNFAKRTVGKLWSQTVQGGIRRAFNIEKAKFNIQGLGKDWEKISHDINEAVSGTAYGFDEAASAAASLAASDVLSTGNDTSPMLKGLKAISGAAAMTGSSFSDIANIFTTVAGNGRLLSQQLNQFSSRSLNAAATLRDYVNAHDDVRKKLIELGLKSAKGKEVKEFQNATKLTEKNIRTLVSGSVVDFKTFSDAMSDAFGEQAKKANTTFNGVMSNIKATLSRIGEAFVHPLIANNDVDNMLDMVDTPLRNAIKLTKQQRKEMKANGEQMISSRKLFIQNMKETPKYANVTDKTLNKMYDKYYKVQYNIVGVLQAVKRVFGVLESTVKNSKFLTSFQRTASKACKILILLFNGLAATFGGVEKGLEVVGEKGKSYFISAEKIWERLRRNLGLGTKDFENLKKTLKGIGDIFSAIAYVIGEVVKAFLPSRKEAKGFTSSILDVTGAIGEALSSFAKFIKKSETIAAIVGVLKTAFSIFYKAINIILIPIKLLIGGISSLIKWFSNFKTPLDGVKTAFDSIFMVFKNTGSAFLKVGKKIVDAFLKPFTKETKKAGKTGKPFSDILDKIANALKSFKEKVAGAGKWISDLSNGFIDFDKITNIGQNVKNAIDNTIIPAFKNLKKFIKGSFDKMKLPDFGSLFAKSSGDLKKGAADIKAPNFKSLFDHTSTSIKNSMANIKLPDFAKIFGDAFGKIGDAILAGLDKVRNIDYKAIFDNIREGFDNFITFLGEAKDKVADAFHNIGEGIRNNLPTFDEFSNKLFEGFKKAVDNMASLLPEPNSFGVMLGDWIAAVISFVAKSIPYIVQILAAGFRTLLSHLPSIITELAKGIKDALNKGLFEPITVGTGEFKREIPPLFDVLSDTFKSLGDKFKGATLDDILGWINKFLTAGVLNQLRKTLKSSAGLTDDIGGFFKKLGGSTDEYLNGENKGIINKFSKLAKAIKDFAIAIGIIAAALVVLGHISEKALQQGKDTLVQIAIGITAFALALSLIQKFTGADLTGMLSGLADLVDGLKGLMVVLMAMTMIKDMSGPLGVMAVILIELGAFVFAMNKVGGNAATATASMTALSGFIESLGSLVKMLVVIAVVPAKKINTAIVQLGLVMAELAALMFVIGKIPVTTAGQALINLVPMIVMLGAAVIALYAIKKYKLDSNQLLMIAASFGILGKTMAILAVIPILGAIKAVANMAIFVAGLLAILAVLGKLNKDPGVRAFIEGGGELLHLVGESIGKLIGGFAEGVMASAPKIADDLSQFAIHLLPFVTTMKMMKGDVSENIKNITGAIKALVDANIKESLSAFLGGGDLSDLAERFGSFMEAFMKVMDSLPEGGKDFNAKIKQVGQIAKVTKTLAEVEKNLESQGGLKSGVFGQKSFEKFISGVKKLFKGFIEIGETAGEIKNIGNINKIKDIAKALADTLAALPDEKKGKFWLDLSGENKLSQFAKDLITFGDSVSEYVSKFSGIDTSQMESVTKSVTKSINSIAKTVSSKGTSKAFSSAGSNAMSTMASGVSDNSSKLSGAFTTAMSNALKQIKTDGFAKKGKELAKAFVDAIEKYDAKSAGAKLVSNATSGMGGSTSNASTAGKNVADGFIGGINSSLKLQAARSAGRALGKAAINGIKEGTDENSPSKTARKAGYYVDTGFIIGIKRYADRVRLASKTVGKEAIIGLKESMSNVQKMVDSNLTTPVIRPVLDLSNVKMGANSISSMFNSHYALGIAGNITTNGVYSSRPINITTNMTVNGADDPAEWANEFMDELTNELTTQARMG